MTVNNGTGTGREPTPRAVAGRGAGSRRRLQAGHDLAGSRATDRSVVDGPTGVVVHEVARRLKPLADAFDERRDRFVFALGLLDVRDDVRDEVELLLLGQLGARRAAPGAQDLADQVRHHLSPLTDA